MYKTHGIIIKKTNLGEFDRIVTIYTKNFGKILTKAKSVRKNQAKLGGRLELFLYDHLMIAPGRGFDIVTSVETINGFSFLHQNLNSLAAAHYLSELLDKLIAGPQRDINIWKLALDSFGKLNQGKGSELIVNNFENQLLEFLGYGKNKDSYAVIRSILNQDLSSRDFLQKTLNKVI